MINLKRPTIITLIGMVFLGSLGNAQQSCHFIHQQSKDIPIWTYEKGFRSHTNELDPQRLKAAGFELSSDRTKLIDLEAPGGPAETAILKIADAPYLFHWGPENIHSDIIRDHGINLGHMQYLFEQNKGGAGRGFYISLDPFDSVSYGTTMTVFKVRDPIIIASLTVTPDFLEKVYSKALVERLSAAGVDAMSNGIYERTAYSSWFNIISIRHLQNVHGIEEVFREQALKAETDGRILAGLTSRIEYLPKSQAMQLPAGNIVRKLVLKELLTPEQKSFLEQNKNQDTHRVVKY